MTAFAPHGQEPQKKGTLEAVESVGPLEMHVETAEMTAESAERWAQRTEAMARWLVAEWQGEEAAQ